jgi:ankyrin repeat protein
MCNPARYARVSQGTPLMCAAKRNQSEAVALLLRRGATPNATDASGNTALHLAAAEGHISAIAALLQGGATPAALNNRQQSPLDVAMRSWGDALLKDKVGRMLSGAASPAGSPTATAPTASAAAANSVSMEQIAV